MVDERDIKAQYSYKANSNLVLPQERRRRIRATDTGEVSALRCGQLGGRMGDQAGARDGDTTRDAELSARLEKRRNRRPSSAAQEAVGSRVLTDVLETADKLQLHAGGVGYIPTTAVSQKAYEGLLAFVMSKLGDQPNEILRGAAEEVLMTLKDDDILEAQKKKAVCELFATNLDDDEFARLSVFGRIVDDFGVNVDVPATDALPEDGADDDAGVAVVFDNDSDSDAPDEVQDPVDEDGNTVVNAVPVLRDDGAGLDDSAAPHDDTVKFGVSDVQKSNASKELNPLEIDGYWIQRQLSPFYADAHECQTKAEVVLATLAKQTDNARCENTLMVEFEFENVDFIKMVVKNRAKVVFCTKRARAQTVDERAVIEEEMIQTEEGKDLLSLLKGDTSVAAEKYPTAEKPRKRRKRDSSSLIDKEQVDRHENRSARKHREGKSKAALRKIDLDHLIFTQGNHLLSSKTCALPPGSEHIKYKEYEEWHIPAAVAESKEGERVALPINDLPSWAQSAFEKMTHLNRLQSAVFPSAFESDSNLLICAPTGAGKTNVALLTILRAVYNSRQPSVGMDDFVLSDADINAFKVVYVAPMKALVAEVVTKLGKCLEPYGMSVRELTGDVNLTRREVEETQVIVTTPEKWDVITRKSGERTYTNLVRLLIIDEIHLLHDDRGPVLEAIIARTIRSVENTTVATRIVGLSATLPNYKDVGTLLQVDENKGLFHFDGSYRPSPLQQCYVGITAKKAMKRFRIMNDITYEKVKSQVLSANQVIVFVHSRKETASTARFLIDKAIEDESIGYFMQHESASYNIIQAELDGVGSGVLKTLLERGVATHHAGMTRKDRDLVEGLFEAGHIKILVSTSTLAWGVNLPAHAVIIKGTQVYAPEKGRWIELSPMDVMQMMGRAGRPQFDKFGEGFIITTRPEVQFYLSLLNEQLPIESQFISRLVDLLNAEIATGCVASIDDGAKWLTYTYLFVRMLKNPTLYNVSVDEKQSDPLLERRRLELVHSAAIILHRSKLVIYNRKSGSLSSTDLGRIASDFYVGNQTMSVYVENVHPTMSDIDLLRLFSLSSEFKHMRVREEEKLEVQRLAEIVPIPVKDSVDETSAKVNVLMQAFISNLRLDGLVLKADMVYITQNAARLTRALLQIAIQKRWAALTERCLQLCKMVANKQWASQTPLRQFSGIVDESVLRKIERKYIDFDRYFGLKSSDLGELLRDRKLGKSAHKLIHSLPRIEMEVVVRPLTRSILEFEVTLTPDFMFESRVHGAGESFWIFVEDSDSEHLLYSESFYLRKAVCKEKHVLVFTVQVTLPRPPHYFVKCCSDRWIAPETVVPVSFQHLILPDKFAPHTNYLGLLPLSIESALVLDGQYAVNEEACAESLANLRTFYKRILGQNFSPLVTQVIPSLFNSPGNSLIATLPSRDRNICASLAIGRLFCLQPASVAVWVAGEGEDTIATVKQSLEHGVGNALDLKVHVLQGDHSADIATLKIGGSIVVCTPQHFDALSRKWQGRKERRALSGVGLVILDGVHRLSEAGDTGSILEVVGSRMRTLTRELWTDGRKPCRIVAVSDPIANAKDVADWLEVPEDALHSFHPSSLPDCPRVEIIPCISRFGGGSLTSPSALSRRIFDVMRRFTTDDAESIVIFVPTRKLSRAMAFELVTMAPAQGISNGFLQESKETVRQHLDKIRLASLKECLSSGVAYLHEGLTTSDRNITEAIFKSGAARILVTTAKYARQSTAVSGRLVVIAGTASEEHGGYSLKRAEYKRSDITAMICCATPCGRSSVATCAVMTESPLQEYYRQTCLQPAPLESQLSDVLADQINAEVASQVIETKENVVAYLTWTFFYRRLPKNPNYYHLRGTSHIEISSHLSDMVEHALAYLKDAKCVDAEGEEDMVLSPLDFGLIAAYYYIRHATVERFASCVTPNLKIKSLLDILSHASEFDDVPTRIGDENAVMLLFEKAHIPPRNMDDASPSFSAIHLKVHLLLQSHMSRFSVGGDLLEDRRFVVGKSVHLLRALVDIISSAGWLRPTLFCMELSQMIVQAVWDPEMPLLQLPHFDENLVTALEQEHNIKSITDFTYMDSTIRRRALSRLTQSQVREVAEALQCYPELSWDVSEPVLTFNDDNQPELLLNVSLERDMDDDDDGNVQVENVPYAFAPRFTSKKLEGWWVVVGEKSSNSLLTVRHVALKRKTTLKLKLNPPEGPGKHILTVYLISDCYVDSDEEETVTVVIPE